MFGAITKVYIYKGSEVDNKMANYLIDEIYRKKGMSPLNSEKNPKA